MHGHSEMLMHEYSFSPAQHVHLGDIPIRLGMSVVSFKPSGEACQTSGECINHLHHVHHTKITILTSNHMHSSMPSAYDNLVWCVLVVHNDDRNVELLDLFVIYEVISLWLQF